MTAVIFQNLIGLHVFNMQLDCLPLFLSVFMSLHEETEAAGPPFVLAKVPKIRTVNCSH